MLVSVEFVIGLNGSCLNVLEGNTYTIWWTNTSKGEWITFMYY